MKKSLLIAILAVTLAASPITAFAQSSSEPAAAVGNGSAGGSAKDGYKPFGDDGTPTDSWKDRDSNADVKKEAEALKKAEKEVSNIVVGSHGSETVLSKALDPREILEAARKIESDDDKIYEAVPRSFDDDGNRITIDLIP